MDKKKIPSGPYRFLSDRPKGLFSGVVLPFRTVSRGPEYPEVLTAEEANASFDSIVLSLFAGESPADISVSYTHLTLPTNSLV